MKNTKSKKRNNKKNITRRYLKKTFELNCHPAINKTNVFQSGSCLTKEILEEIKKEYNSRHRGKYDTNKITSNNPEKILDDLYERFPKCKKNTEYCIIYNSVHDPKRFQKIILDTFRPNKPESWYENPNTWVSSLQIKQVLTQYEKAIPNFCFLGMARLDYDSKVKNGELLDRSNPQYSLLKKFNNNMPVIYDIPDSNNPRSGAYVFKENQYVNSVLVHLPRKIHTYNQKEQFAIVFNTANHTDPGIHAVSLYISIPDRIIFYFDSGGYPPHPNIKKLIDNLLESYKDKYDFQYIESNVRHQYGPTECGMYTLYFIITMISDMPLKKKLNIFLNKKKRITDKFVASLRDVYFI